MIYAASFVFIMSIAVWLGSMVFFSFFAAPSIFKTLPRETAGDVVGDIFPKYWMVGYVCGALSIVSYVYISGVEKADDIAMVALLAGMLVLMLFSGLVVGNNARIIKRKMRDTPDTEVRERLRKDFMKIHAVSSVLNLIIMVLGVVVVICMSINFGGYFRRTGYEKVMNSDSKSFYTPSYGASCGDAKEMPGDTQI